MMHGLIGNSKGTKNFDYYSHGTILVLEDPADFDEVKTIGLTEGLTDGIPPEAIEEFDCGSQKIYELSYLANNQFCYSVFLEKSLADQLRGWKDLWKRHGISAKNAISGKEKE